MQQDEEEGSLEASSKADRDTISDQSIDTKYDSWQTLKRIWGTVSPSLDNEIMWKCLYFCYLFPKAYNFYKEDIIHIWLAQGFFPVSEMMEYCISLYFNEFEKLQIFLLSGLDCSTRRLRYRVNNSIVNLLVECHSDEYSRVDDAVSYVSRNTLHYSCGDSSIDPITLQDLYRAEKLSTLLILHQSGSCFDKIPRELFLNLPFLRVLDLSYTHIVALPSSIAKLKDLRYLNLSGTPMTMLPSSMCTLCKLQVLKLRGCLKFVSLPRDLRKLKCLRHLDLDLSCLLVSMPSGIGNLTELRSLPAFVVGKHDGFHINELKFMNNLGGTLRIMRLENVANLEETKEASLDQKLNVRKIELHWTEVIDGNELLENLKPHKSVSELQITGYGGVKFPCWIGQPLFSQLLSITIHDCKKCELLPPLGKLPLLSDLYISDMHEVKDIDQRLCSRNSNVESLDNDKSCDANMFKAFPSLVKFTLSGMPKLEKWSGIEEGDFPRLKKLSISDCGILIAPPKLSLLKSLRQLEISLCPSLSNFPTEGLPGSLGVIVIIDCPLLKEWCHKDGVQASGMLERIPNVWIDHHQILRVSPSPTTGDSPLPSQNFEPNVQELSDTDTDKGNRVGVDSLIMIELHESPEKTLESPLPTAGNSHLPSDNCGPNVRVLSDTDMEKGKREGVDSLIMIEPHGSPEKILASPSPTTGDSPSPSKKFEHNIQVLSSTDMEKRNSEDVGSLIMIESHWSPEKRLASPPTTGNSPLPSQNIEPNVRELLGANMKEGNRAGVDSLIIIEPHGSPEKRLGRSRSRDMPKHEAALILQKVYKSFRTRRKLADCAVLVEQRWGKLLDFIQLKRRSVSFFDTEKPETAEKPETSVSRWSRTRNRAAKVLSQKLALQHWLEAIDPRHRYGHNLHFYYVTWLHCESHQPFFYWLDIGEGNEVNLVDRCPRSKLQHQCIKYLGPVEREAYEVVVENGKFMYKQSGQILDTSEGSGDTKWIFVLSTCKTLYVGQKSKGRFHHSSFLAGGATSAAGRLVVENGILKAVWPHSGHYRPTEQIFQEFVTFLKEHNVDLTDVKKSPTDEDEVSFRHEASSDLSQYASDLESENADSRNDMSESTSENTDSELKEQNSNRSLHFKEKLASLEIPRRTEDDALSRQPSNNHSEKAEVCGSETAEDSLDSEEVDVYMFPKKNLFDEDEEGMKSYQLGKQSCKWATGAGPRIGCVSYYRSKLQSRGLEQESLSLRSAARSRLAIK